MNKFISLTIIFISNFLVSFDKNAIEVIFSLLIIGLKIFKNILQLSALARKILKFCITIYRSMTVFSISDYILIRSCSIRLERQF